MAGIMSKTINTHNNRFRVKIWNLTDGTQFRLILDREWEEIFWEWWVYDGKFGSEVISREYVRDYIKMIKNR